MEYKTELVGLSEMDAHCNANALAGWRLVTAFIHSNQSNNEDPRIVTIWSR